MYYIPESNVLKINLLSFFFMYIMQYNNIPTSIILFLLKVYDIARLALDSPDETDSV